MAITEQQKASLLGVTSFMFNYAPDQASFERFEAIIENNPSFYALGTDLARTEAFTSQFEEGATPAEKIDVILTRLGLEEGELGYTRGVDFITERLEQGAPEGQVLMEIGEKLLQETPPEGLEGAAAVLKNKIAVSDAYLESGISGYSLDTMPNLMDSITAEDESVEAALAAIEERAGQEPEEPGVPGETFNLTVGQDIVEGTAGDDTFVSYVAQNPNGQQVNTLGSGDVIDGGAGVDTLEAQVTTGAWVNGGSTSNMAIGPVTRSVENIILQAEIANFGLLQNDTVIINAKNMEGVNKIASNHSDASLMVQNMTSNGVAGGTANMTVGMEYTGNADTNWVESDMTVYFDQDYLTRATVETNSLYYFTQDRLATAESNQPFGAETTAVRGLRFTMDGELVEIIIPEDELTEFLNNVPADNMAAYEGFTKLLQDALSAKQAEVGGALNDVTISLDKELVRTHGGQNNDGDPLDQPAPAIVVTAPDGIQITEPAMSQTDKYLPHYDMFNSTQITAPTVSDTPVSINVDLEKVGLAADGGDLIIGSMNKDGENVFGNNQGITVTDTVAGFDEFNVHVAGGKGQNSSLASLHSTDNTLRKVAVDSKEGGDANLTIGNSNTDTEFLADDGTGEVAANSARNAQALKDVQVLDASQFNGDLTLFAGITDESVAKYLANEAGTTLYGLNNARNELAEFNYQGGNGNDVLDIRIDGSIIEDNLAAGTDATDTNGFNVFEMNIDGGAGNDLITVVMDEASVENNASNITINGGLGNDTINISQGTAAADFDSADWSFTVAFSGAHFGHDTLIGFDAADVEVSDELQTLDLSGFTAHEGEAIVVTVGGQTLAPIVITTDMDADAIAAQVATALSEGDDSFFDTATTTDDQVALVREGLDQKRVTVEIHEYNEANGTWELGTGPVHSATSEVATQGGIRSGGDVLDFSSYGAKAVNFGGVTYEADDYDADTDVLVNMTVSAHNDEVYNVAIGDNTIGSIEFVGGIAPGDMNADAFVFA